ncbi:MAG: hypothetical protein WD696_00955 [Bryobacteraceae bacterium]
MRARLTAVALALCLTAAAQTTLNVDQLVSFVKSSIQLRHPDKQVANYLSKLKLSERLSASIVEDLEAAGVGPKTLEALRNLTEETRSLPPPQPKTVQVASPIPAPSPEEQKRVIEEARQYAIHYSQRLPDFICTQITRRHYDPSGLELWQQHDVITARLSYFDQKEDYKLVLINNRLTQQSYESLGGASSTGEFGSLLRQVFEEKSRTRFEWERWATLRGRRAHVFKYRVAQPNSQWSISYEKRLEIISGYKGLLYVDRDTGFVLRVTLEAEDIPASFPIHEASTVLDYDFTKIGEAEFMLPLRAVIRMRENKFLTRNEVEFRLYRKFSADAVITFDSTDVPEALPKDRTEEQPPK